MLLTSILHLGLIHRTFTECLPCVKCSWNVATDAKQGKVPLSMGVEVEKKRGNSHKGRRKRGASQA